MNVQTPNLNRMVTEFVRLKGDLGVRVEVLPQPGLGGRYAASLHWSGKFIMGVSGNSAEDALSSLDYCCRHYLSLADYK